MLPFLRGLAGGEPLYHFGSGGAGMHGCRYCCDCHRIALILNLQDYNIKTDFIVI